MATESIHQKLERVRKPHVHIKYDVEEGGATVVKELPFVVGVMGDYAGDPTSPLKPLKERKFTDINRENFNKVMSALNAGLNLRVENTLAGDGTEIGVTLKFKSLEDFSPANIVQQVESLRKLLEARNNLQNLLTKANTRPDLERLLEELLRDTNAQQNLRKELDENAAKTTGSNP